MHRLAFLNLRLELEFQVREILQGPIKIGLGCAQIPALLHGLAGCLGGGRGLAHICLADRLPAEKRSQNRVAKCNSGVPLGLACLGLFSIQLLARLADVFLKLVALRCVPGAKFLVCPVASLARVLREAEPEIALRFLGAGIGFEIRARPDGQLALAIKVVLQALCVFGIRLGPGQCAG